METMTLEELREFTLLNFVHKNMHRIIASFDAAIRERNELTMRGITWMKEAQTLRARADKAESELAELKKRIAEAQMETVNKPGSYWGGGASFGIVMALVDAKLIGRPVRLLVEDDNEH